MLRFDIYNFFFWIKIFNNMCITVVFLIALAVY